MKQVIAATTDEMIDAFLNADWLWVMYGWFYGSAMGMQVSHLIASGLTIRPSKYTKANYRELIHVLNLFHTMFPQKPKTLYRVIAQPKTKTFKEGSKVKLITGKNTVQSWTDNLDSALQFHKDVYSKHPEKGKQYLIIKCYGQPITTRDVVVKVLNWMYLNLDKYADRSTDKIWINTLKTRRNGVRSLIKTMLVRLNSKMIVSQREQIVFVPKPIPVIVVKVVL